MNSAYITLTAVGIGGIIGWIGSYWSHFLQARKERREHKQKKLNQLAEILIEIEGFSIQLPKDQGELLANLWNLRKRLKLNSLHNPDFVTEANQIFIMLEEMAKTILQRQPETADEYLSIVSEHHPQIRKAVEDMLIEIQSVLGSLTG
jgi:hypothetical protein